MMPVMDGYQALMGIRNLEKERNIPKEKQAKISAGATKPPPMSAKPGKIPKHI